MSEVEARTVLWYLVFFGFAVNYMTRINLNIAIVEMVKHSKIKSSQVKTNNIPNFQTNLNASFLKSLVSSENGSGMELELQINRQMKIQTVEKHILEAFNINYEENGFSWNEYEQGLVLGSFFWLYWLTQVPGGVLANQYGTKLIFGLSNAIGCWICFLLPILSYFDYKILIFARIIQGLVVGLTWPAMHHMAAKWIPPNERSKFVSAYLGGSVGIAICYPLFGYILTISSWEWVFHLCGIIGTIWYIAWLYFVFDSPAEHPRISQTELRYIEKSLGTSIATELQTRTPWVDIFKSMPVWINVIAQWGGIWALFTIMTQAPTYFRNIHHWNIGMTGVLSGLPHLARMTFAYVFSMFGDYLLKTEKMTRTNVRKLASAICLILTGIFVLALAYSGSSSTASLVFVTLATMSQGAVSTGPLASLVDIAPNYAGVLLGISGMVTVIPGFVSPVIVGYLTLGNQTVQSWKYVFLISSGMLIGCGILYVLFGDSTLQSWNSPKSNSVLDKEMQSLNLNNNTDDIDKAKVKRLTKNIKSVN